MNRILLAAVAVFGFAGIAAAQQAPVLIGDFSASVVDNYDGVALDPGGAGLDIESTASIINTSEDRVSRSEDPARVTAEELFSRK